MSQLLATPSPTVLDGCCVCTLHRLHAPLRRKNEQGACLPYLPLRLLPPLPLCSVSTPPPSAPLPSLPCPSLHGGWVSGLTLGGQHVGEELVPAAGTLARFVHVEVEDAQRLDLERAR